MIDRDLLKQPMPGIKPETIMTPELCNRLQDHAVEAYPQECMGYVKDGEYHRLDNISKTPEANARISSEDMVRLMEIEPDAICHSHPHGPNCPSMQDMVFQEQTDCPHAIVSTDGKGCYPVFMYGDMLEKPGPLGRSFHYGIRDCYDIIRDTFKVAFEIDLPNFPRDWEWWSEKNRNGGDGMYLENFRKAGFHEIDRNLEAKDGDVFLMKVLSQIPNHAGIYIGNGLMLHHLTGRFESDPTRLSVDEPVVRWQSGNRITNFLRHEAFL